MATTRVIAVASSTTASCMLFKKPFLLKHTPYSNNLCFKNLRVASSAKSLFTCSAIYNPEVQFKEEGQPETLDYRVFFVDNSGKKISPWHDIPLHLGNGLFNFIVEIPKESSAKMEVATDEPYTPIKQDTKKGKLRYYPGPFSRVKDMLRLHGSRVPHHQKRKIGVSMSIFIWKLVVIINSLPSPSLWHNINWNYGLLPQTWEDPSFPNSEVEGALGDNDPVDVVEIGESRRKIGEILKVKPLAALAMIDEGELDWKIVAISLDDPRASLVNDIDDVEKHFPGTLTAIRDWFRDYKIPDGKPANKFGLGNKAANKDYALKVITETNESWAKLVKRSIPSGELSLV